MDTPASAHTRAPHGWTQYNPYGPPYGSSYPSVSPGGMSPTDTSGHHVDYQNGNVFPTYAPRTTTERPTGGQWRRDSATGEYYQASVGKSERGRESKYRANVFKSGGERKREGW
ncbi:hypothetical protein MNV49_007554 [Pseudohyphozyma bogoriensis]|nr:hypothetical protein MNV49_007554 [Pseudohyphozyma bogoriensis]